MAQPVLNGYCGDYEYGMEKSVVLAPEFNFLHKIEKIIKKDGVKIEIKKYWNEKSIKIGVKMQKK